MLTFEDYALSSNLTGDEKYTIELLIDRVRSEFDPHYWDDWGERVDARKTSNYVPSFDHAHVLLASEKLRNLSWLSFQRVDNKVRPVRDLRALQYLPQLSTLVLAGNEISDLSPLVGCKNLVELVLKCNPVRDLSHLASCLELERLSLEDTPANDISILASLPVLRTLSLSADHLPALRQLGKLSVLRELDVTFGSFDSFAGFPDMPELRIIRGVCVKSLDGIGRFRKLQNLINFSGEMTSLLPLVGLKEITHAIFQETSIESLEPLAELLALRELRLDTSAQKIDLSPLERLPALHEVAIRCAGNEIEGLEFFRSQLLSWDVEFRSEKPRHTPSLELLVVDQATFDIYDGKKPHNVAEADSNYKLLASELQWLDEQLEAVLEVDFEQDEDFSIPYRWSGARSRTVVFLSDCAVEAFSRLVLGMQSVLSHARRDWILYLQSDGPAADFIVWVYPDKIMVADEYAEVVRDLVRQK